MIARWILKRLPRRLPWCPQKQKNLGGLALALWRDAHDETAPREGKVAQPNGVLEDKGDRRTHAAVVVVDERDLPGYRVEICPAASDDG